MKIKVSFLLILLLVVSSCSKDTETRLFKAGLFNSLISTSKLDIIEADLLNTNTAIKRPPFAWKPLFVATVEDKRGASPLCFFYRTPHRDLLGELRLVPLKNLKECRAVVDPAGEFALASLSDISELKLFKGGRDLSDEEIALEFLYHGEKIRIQIPFYNLQQKKAFKRFSSAAKKSLLTGVRIKTDIALTDSEIISSKSLLPIAKDAPTICHRVDSECKEVSPNICNRCQYGWFPGASGVSCKGGGTKYCRPNTCGEKGMPACPRGLNHRTYKSEDVCMPDSPNAFCRDGLRVVCNERKELICL